ncbi:uncharacterized protein N7529_009368 [Penicillium soppii]|uniref:uncharacterized protein n=1 Tax=Penicillium soppii TaxID=69789 RepID=UPI002548A625|nr:uncharacterized protein N7529_009368 [Penicillium soppii]KAJ5855424.1 hypothetical protein N7529_009368 [Penicillium soppii]
MKFTIFALSAVLALAIADTTTTAGSSTITTTPEVECAKQCDARDTCCTAKCYHVPCPSDNEADDTNSCVSACPQGTGSPADTQRYADCEQSCLNSHFWGGSGATATHPTSTSGATATQTGSSSTSTDSSESSSDSNGSSSSDSSDGTATSSSGFTQQTTNAAPHVTLGASAAGLFGLVVAAFAL